MWDAGDAMGVASQFLLHGLDAYEYGGKCHFLFVLHTAQPNAVHGEPGSSSYKVERNRDTEFTERGSSLTQRASKTRRERVITKLKL